MSSASDSSSVVASPTSRDSSETSWQTGDLMPYIADFGDVPNSWSEQEQNIVKKPYTYILSHKGKGFRTQFLQALNVWLNVDAKSCAVIDDTISMLHNSSLLIDDIQDESKYRRGALAAHEVYGTAQTINAANYVYFEAQQGLRQLECWPQLFLIFNEELLQLHRGQGMELFWRETMQPPSIDEYLRLISNKTGGLFRLALRLMQELSDCDYNIYPLVDLLGLMFQIVDDYKNLKDAKMNSQKGYCEDITEGKFSFLISHAVWINDSKRGDILRILKMRTLDNDLKAFVVQCLEESGSFEYTRQTVYQLRDRAKQLLANIPQPNPAIEGLLDTLTAGL
ncbi:isoprenoid synthase domain-containing protein [Aspergillus alliaceus]|uniref:Isoprenoid synthase domain-containing protein n=1 Tax=Petromyces alliaceus TaxID=209559 RepID=A0A5N7BUJ0_PETAA|nr:isoprenoid synthase domain-containing protein [Aspergillus alliaceus]